MLYYNKGDILDADITEAIIIVTLIQYPFYGINKLHWLIMLLQCRYLSQNAAANLF